MRYIQCGVRASCAAAIVFWDCAKRTRIEDELQTYDYRTGADAVRFCIQTDRQWYGVAMGACCAHKHLQHTHTVHKCRRLHQELRREVVVDQHGSNL